MEFVKAKTILTKVKNGNEWYGVDYNMNLYRGCSHGCIYCDSRSDCYHIENFDIVKGKENMIHILENELCKKRKKGVVGIGAMSDTYNPMEIKYKQTRGALQLISKYGFGVSIDTKSDLILRDIDLLKEINSKNSVIIKFTITTPHEKLSKIIRDADKLDNYRVKKDENIEAIFPKRVKNREDMENAILSDKVYETILNKKCVDIHDRVTPLDFWVCILAFTFDLNFDVTYKIVKENDYINVLIDRFDYKDKETKARMESIRKIVNKFIDEKINNI